MSEGSLGGESQEELVMSNDDVTMCHIIRWRHDDGDMAHELRCKPVLIRSRTSTISASPDSCSSSQVSSWPIKLKFGEMTRRFACR